LIPPDARIEEKTTDETRRVPYQHGVGTELQRVLPWLDSSDFVDSLNRSRTVDVRQHLDDVVSQLLIIAFAKGLPPEIFSRDMAKSLLLTAVRRFERKFPDGIQETNEESNEVDR
jgi:hypothetical protein